MRRTGWMTFALLACALASVLGCTRSSSSRSVTVVAPPAPAPAVLSLTGMDPTFGAVGGGNQIQIFGTGFLTGANVRFEGTLGTNAQVLSPTTIVVTVPAGVTGPADVDVTLADGRSATLIDGYLYGTPAPIVTAISPSSGAIVGGTLVTITGTGFIRNGASQATVTIGGNPATRVTVVSGGMITALTPLSGVSGAVNVVVTNPGPMSSTLVAGFTYLADSTAPVFGGITGVKQISPYALELSWSAATDNSTASSLITYAIYQSIASGTQNFSAPVAVSPAGATRFTVGGLTPSTNYYYVVRASDLSGNADSNLVELAGTPAAAVSPAWGPAGAMSVGRADPAVVVLTDGRVIAAGGRDGVGPLSSTELYDPATGTWTATGGMAAARDQAAAALLPDGRVLITGGANGTGQLATCEIWDPTTGTWASTGSFAARQRHGLTLLPGGQLLAAGGLDGSGPVASAELYDPSTTTWAATGSFTAGRDWHQQVLLANGQVLAAGGGTGTGITTACELYNPSTTTWTATGALGTARLGALAVMLRDGRVVLGGGLDATSTPLGTAELYSPTAGTWAVTGSMGGARVFPSGVLLPSGRVQAAGGGSNTVQEYDPGTGQWVSALGFQTARDSHRAALLSGGRTLLIGGQNSGGPISGCEIETTVKGDWVAVASAQTARGRHGATVMPDGRVLVAGGYRGNSTTGLFSVTSSELYDPDTDVWTNTGNFNTARFGFTQTLLSDGRVLAASGTSTGGNVLGSELYDPVTGGWSSISGPLFGRMNHSGTLLRDGTVLVAGGWTGTLILNQVEIFNPGSNSWANATSLWQGRAWHASARLADGRVLVAGGWDGFQAINTAELYDPSTGLWGITGAFSNARYGGTSTLLRNGKVLFVGGIDTAGNNRTDADLYDPAAGTWAAVAALPASTAGHTATLLDSGRVLIAGGFVQPQIYDPGVNTWFTAPNLGTARFIHTASLLRNGRVLIAGGSNGNTLATNELWDGGLGISQQWRPVITSVLADSASPTDLTYSSTIAVLGSGLRGASEGGTGNFTNPSNGSPVVQLIGPFGSSGAYLDNSPAIEVLSFPATFAADGSRVDITTPASTAVGKGFYQLRVIVGGVASKAWIVKFP